MRKITILLLATLVLISLPAFAAEDAVKRTSYGKPDLSGTYDAGTVTPVDRPSQFGDNLYLSPEEAKKLEETQASFWADAEADKGGGADRGAPPVGGDGDNRFGGGGVGGYNIFWIDPGTEAVMVDGKFRTSIIYEPKNGRRPSMTPQGMRKMASNFSSFSHNNDAVGPGLAVVVADENQVDVGLPPDDIVREAAAKNGGEDVIVCPDLFEELLQRGFVACGLWAFGLWAFGLWAFGLWAGGSGGSGHPGSPG